MLTKGDRRLDGFVVVVVGRGRHVKRCAHKNQQGKVASLRLMNANKGQQKSLACINVPHHPLVKIRKNQKEEKRDEARRGLGTATFDGLRKEKGAVQCCAGPSNNARSGLVRLLELGLGVLRVGGCGCKRTTERTDGGTGHLTVEYLDKCVLVARGRV